MKIDMSSIGTKFENFVQAGCRDFWFAPWANHVLLTAHYSSQVVFFLGTFLELPVLPSIIFKIHYWMLHDKHEYKFSYVF